LSDTAAHTTTPRHRQIVATARELLETEGQSALTMRALAERLGIRAPSLYKHIPDKEALQHALIEVAFEELGDAFEHAQAATGDLLPAMAHAYRRFALAHPHLYRLMTEHPLDRSRIRPGVEERAARLSIASFGGDEDTARALWAFAHGMVILELNNRFPARAELDLAWAKGVRAFAALADRSGS
jgi:AcrR family transcriptional regulator